MWLALALALTLTKTDKHLGQNPTSIEFLSSSCHGMETIWILRLQAGQFLGQRVANDIVQQAATLLGELGITFPQPPPLFRLAFFHDQDQVLDPLVDDIGDNENRKALGKSSTSRPFIKRRIRPNPAKFIPGNYLSWLATCA